MDEKLTFFVHEENIRHLWRKLTATTDEAERARLMKLLAEEEAKVSIRFQSRPPFRVQSRPLGGCRIGAVGVADRRVLRGGRSAPGALMRDSATEAISCGF